VPAATQVSEYTAASVRPPPRTRVRSGSATPATGIPGRPTVHTSEPSSRFHTCASSSRSVVTAIGVPFLHGVLQSCGDGFPVGVRGTKRGARRPCVRGQVGHQRRDPRIGDRVPDSRDTDIPFSGLQLPARDGGLDARGPVAFGDARPGVQVADDGVERRRPPRAACRSARRPTGQAPALGPLWRFAGLGRSHRHGRADRRWPASGRRAPERPV
jgi:hypothetical protein